MIEKCSLKFYGWHWNYLERLQNANSWSVSSISKGIHELGHGGLENQNVDIENTSCLSMTSSNVSLPVCRICQLPGVEPSNPLISPCRCLGSIRYVHNNCLLVSTYVPISSLGLPEFLKTFQLWWKVSTPLFVWLYGSDNFNPCFLIDGSLCAKQLPARKYLFRLVSSLGLPEILKTFRIGDGGFIFLFLVPEFESPQPSLINNGC